MLPPIYTILSGDSGVAALVGTRIYPHGEAPEGVARPYVTWFMVTGIPENELDDLPSVDRCPVQIDCWSETSAGVVALAMAVRDAVESHSHMTAAPFNGREPETKLYRIAIQIDYWLSR